MGGVWPAGPDGGPCAGRDGDDLPPVGPPLRVPGGVLRALLLLPLCLGVPAVPQVSAAKWETPLYPDTDTDP